MGPKSGIIPAHAGFTAYRFPPFRVRQDHPRTRGVYRDAVKNDIYERGSSPHTRGLQAQRRAIGLASGIIPAHAGFTQGRRQWGTLTTDHPRTRGVYRDVEKTFITGQGSSPHTRGLRPRDWGRDPERRIIPAHAGFTLGDPWNPNGPAVYHPPVSFTADLVPARRSCGSAAVEPRWTRTPWAA